VPAANAPETNVPDPRPAGRSRDFLVPDLGEGLEEVTIVAWMVATGDEVALNQPLCLVETAKAEVEIPSPFSGRVDVLCGEPGDTLAVGSLLARFVIDEDAVPVERTAVLVGYGVDETPERSRRRSASVVSTALGTETGRRSSSTRPRAKPPVRKLAATLGVDLATLAPGSGPGGIVTRDDVLAAADTGAPTTRPAPTAVPAATPTRIAKPVVVDADRVIPVTGIRARIAQRMATSRAHIPDATASVTVDCTHLLEVRASLKDAAARTGGAAGAAGAGGGADTMTPFAVMARLLVDVVRAHPMLNATFVEDVPEIRVHAAVHLGIGTATERGLVVTVVKNAQDLSTLELAQEIARLAAGARAGTLSPVELTGSTFTVSNFGALGLDEGIPVINHPEAAILGIGSIKPRAVVVDGAVVARPTATITCAFDHRVCDGAEVGAFMSDLRSMFEQPGRALLHS